MLYPFFNSPLPSIKPTTNFLPDPAESHETLVSTSNSHWESIFYFLTTKTKLKLPINFKHLAHWMMTTPLSSLMYTAA